MRPADMPETDTPDGADSLAADVAQLMKTVGERVRKARELTGLPRRVVSERSGVSPRYLAQLEAGEGNISIGLLMRVAATLGQRIEWLVGEDDPWTSDVLQFSELYRKADPDSRATALKSLRAADAGASKAQRVALIGLRGAGKSTLGARAALALNLPFVELTDEIEAMAGMPVSEVVALYGQDGYRDLEARSLDRVIATHDKVVLAVAGGIVAEQDTFAALMSNFRTIWIKTSPEEHMARVRGQGDTRPMAGNPEAMTQLRAILRSREALYERAEARLDTAGRALDQSTADLIEMIGQGAPED